MRTVPVGQAAGQGQNLFRAYCFATDQVGDAVRMLGDRVGSSYQVTKVDIDSPSPVESISVGVIAQKLAPQVCLVLRAGILAGAYSGLAWGRLVFVGVDARLTTARPVRPGSGGRMIQVVGQTVAADAVLVAVSPPVQVIPE